MASRAQRLRQEAQARIGAQLSSGWTLESLIGFGGAASVYLATKGPQRVAIKLLHEEYIGHEIIEQRFEREASIAINLDHPHILKVFEIDRLPNRQLYMVMELLEGINLQQHLKEQGGKLDLRESLHIGAQILSALERCHNAGITHRDLKPANLFLTTRQKIKVLDFGVARLEQSDAQLTREGTALGTPAYMPPEQARGRLDLLDARSDLFAVGATLYTLLTGEHLHKAPSAEESLILAATKPAESIARIDPTLPSDVIALIDKALTWNPSKRFQNADQMLSALNACLHSLEATSGPTTKRPDEGSAMMAQAIMESVEGPKSFATEEPNDAQISDQEGAVDRSVIKAIEHTFGLAERYMAAIRQYSADHAETLKYQEQAYQSMIDVLARIPSTHLALKILPHSLLLDQEVVWEPHPPFDQIPYNLFSSGLRRLTLLSGLERDEYLQLLQIFQLDPQRDLAPEDDLSTVLWQKELPHIQLQLVSTFQLDDAQDQEQFLEDCAQEQPRIQARQQEALRLQIERTRILLSLGADALAEAQGMAHQAQQEIHQVINATHVGLLQARELRQLKAAIEQPQPPIEQRLPVVLVQALKEALRGQQDHETIVRALRLMMGRLVQSDRVLAALTMYGRLASHLEQRELLAQLTGQIMSDDVITRIIESYGRWLDDEQNAAIARDERNLRYLKELLLNVDGRFAPQLVQLYRKAQRERGLVILCYGYLHRHYRGHEDTIGQLLGELPVAHGKKIIELLLQEQRPEGLRALRFADKNPETAFRLAVLELRAQHQGDELESQLHGLAHDPDPHTRIRALQVAQKHRAKNLTPLLLKRIEDDSFFDLPYSERRLLLGLLLDNDHKQAYRICLELLKSHGLVANDTRNTTRILAVELLTHMPATADVIAALQEATKRRWWNSKELQEAAQALLDRHLQGGQRR